MIISAPVQTAVWYARPSGTSCRVGLHVSAMQPVSGRDGTENEPPGAARSVRNLDRCSAHHTSNERFGQDVVAVTTSSSWRDNTAVTANPSAVSITLLK